jgi:hypothetical protein
VREESAALAGKDEVQRGAAGGGGHEGCVAESPALTGEAGHVGALGPRELSWFCAVVPASVTGVDVPNDEVRLQRGDLLENCQQVAGEGWHHIKAGNANCVVGGGAADVHHDQFDPVWHWWGWDHRRREEKTVYQDGHSPTFFALAKAGVHVKANSQFAEYFLRWVPNLLKSNHRGGDRIEGS